LDCSEPHSIDLESDLVTQMLIEVGSIDRKIEESVNTKLPELVNEALGDMTQCDYHNLGNFLEESFSINTLVETGIYAFNAVTVEEWGDESYSGVMSNHNMPSEYRVSVSTNVSMLDVKSVRQIVEQHNYDNSGHYNNYIVMRTFTLTSEYRDGSIIETISDVAELPLLVSMDGRSYLKITPADSVAIGEKKSYMMSITPRYFDVALQAGTHQSMSVDYNPNTMPTIPEMLDVQGQLPVSYNAVKACIGDIETSLENIITKYGLGGDSE
jgi:hypothetical protein